MLSKAARRFQRTEHAQFLYQMWKAAFEVGVSMSLHKVIFKYTINIQKLLWKTLHMKENDHLNVKL